MIAHRAGGSNIRDGSMAANVAWILEQNPGERIVSWAHNGHVSRGRLWGMQWMGSHLERIFPGDMVIFGFATSAGVYTAMSAGGKGLRPDHPLLTPLADSVEAYFAATGQPRLMLDIRAVAGDDPGAFAATTLQMRSIGALAMKEQFFPCVPRDMFDVLVWQAETTASVPLSK